VRKRHSSYDSEDDEDEEDGDDDQNKKGFNPREFYEDEETLNNVVHMMIKTSENMSDHEDMKPVKDLLSSIVVDLMTQSMNKKGAGFNKTNSAGETVLFMAIKSKQQAIAQKMIESGAMDLTAQQQKTGLTPMHLVAALKEGSIDLKVVF